MVSPRFMFAGNEIKTRSPARPPRFASGPHRELNDAIKEGRDLPEWYLEQLSPEMRVTVAEMMNKRRAKLAHEARGED